MNEKTKMKRSKKLEQLMSSSCPLSLRKMNIFYRASLPRLFDHQHRSLSRPIAAAAVVARELHGLSISHRTYSSSTIIIKTEKVIFMLNIPSFAAPCARNVRSLLL